MKNDFPEPILIRKEKCRYRQSLTSQAISQASAKARERLGQCKPFIDAKSVAIYWPTQGELDPLPLLDSCPDKQFALPVIVMKPEKKIHFYAYDKSDRMQTNQFGIEEPIPVAEKKWQIANIHVILVPMVAFDVKKNRIGHGLGFYDRTLVFSKDPCRRPILIGFAYDWQRVEELPHKSWDVPMDCVVTDLNVYL